MSLMLRKACQPLLDNVGLNNYHVSIDPPSKLLRIDGECGDTLAVVKGITFTRINPTNQEIEYAVELFDAFIIKYSAEITNLVTAIKTAKAYSNPELPENVSIKIELQRIKFNWRDYYVTINSKGHLLELILENFKETSSAILINKFNEVNIPDKLIMSFMKLYQQKEAFQKHRKLVDEAINALSTCSI